MTTKPYRGPKGEAWALQAFQSKTAKAGGVVRRSIAAATKANGLKQLISIAKAKGYTVIENGNQIVIFCNSGPLITR